MVGVAVFLTLTRASTADDRSEAARLMVEAVPFATGGLDRLQRHFFSDSGMVRVQYSGPKRSLCVEGKIWKDGKLTEGPAVVPVIRDGDTGDVSVTVREDWISRGESVHIVKILCWLGGGVTFELPEALPSTAQVASVLSLPEPVTAAGTDEVLVWARAWHTRDKRLTGDSIAECLRNSEYAIVLALRVEDTRE